jgi:hypothetical protein
MQLATGYHLTMPCTVRPVLGHQLPLIAIEDPTERGSRETSTSFRQGTPSKGREEFNDIVSFDHLKGHHPLDPLCAHRYRLIYQSAVFRAPPPTLHDSQLGDISYTMRSKKVTVRNRTRIYSGACPLPDVKAKIKTGWQPPPYVPGYFGGHVSERHWYYIMAEVDDIICPMYPLLNLTPELLVGFQGLQPEKGHSVWYTRCHTACRCASIRLRPKGGKLVVILIESQLSMLT